MASVPVYNPDQVGRVQMDETIQSGAQYVAQGAENLASGLEAGARVAEKVAEKQDSIWAMKTFTAAQMDWFGKVKGYTDMDSFSKDFVDYTKTTMKQAPTGRASDLLVQQMNQFQTRLSRRVLVQGAHALIGQNTADFNAAAQNIVNTVTGGDATPSDIGAAREQLSSVRDTFSGAVPGTTMNNYLSDAHEQLDVAEVSNVPPAQALQMIEEGKALTNVSPERKKSLVNELTLKNATDRGVATIAAKKLLSNDLDSIAQGNFPTQKQIEEHAANFGIVMGGAKGKNADGAQLKYATAIQQAMDTYNAKATLFGKTNQEMEAEVTKVKDQFGVNSPIYKATLQEARSLAGLKKSSPFDYAISSTQLQREYATSSDTLNKALSSGDPVKVSAAAGAFQEVVNKALAVQEAAGIPASKQSVLTKNFAQELATRISSEKPDEAAGILNSIKLQFGDNAGIAMRDLASLGKLSAGYKLAVSNDLSQVGSGRKLMEALSYDKALGKKDGSGGLMETIKQRFGGKVKSEQEFYDATATYAISWQSMGMGEQGWDSDVRDLQESLVKYSQYHMLKHPESTVEQASKAAYEELVGNRFELSSGAKNNGVSYLIPKVYNGRPLSPDQIGNIQDRLPGHLSKIAADIGEDQAADFMKAPVSKENTDYVKRLILSNGVWRLSPDKQSFSLVINGRGLSYLTMDGLKSPESGVRSLPDYKNDTATFKVSIKDLLDDKWAEENTVRESWPSLFTPGHN